MKKKYFYNSIISFILIVSTILMPLSFLPKKAEAQMSVAGYTAGLAPAIAKLPQCGGSALGAVKGLFNGIGSLLSSGNSATPLISEEDIANEVGSSLSSDSLKYVSDEAINSATANPVSDKTAQDLLGKIAASTAKNAAADKENSDNATCIASIGRLIIKMLLQKLTVSTVNWINSGFNGGPAFVQDPSKFFGDIAQNQILQFGAEINGISPFSKDWIINNALAYKKKFADNATYSLNEMIAQTTPSCEGADGIVTGCDEKFAQDFSVGGWNAWTAVTQVPANNPLGAKLMFDNEIQKRLAGTSQSVAQDTRDALQAANGFLGDYRCADPIGVTKAQDDAALRGTPSKKLCNRWEYVTPGSMVAYAAQNVIGYQSQSYLNVQDLNDAVAAITDALLNQFSSTTMEKGFANLGNQGADGTLYTSGSTSEPYRTQTQKDFMPSQLTSSWLTANPDFNIRTDLTQALIDEQRTYSDKLAQQNKELNSTTDGQLYRVNGSTITKADGTIVPISNAYGLMPDIYQLDYCIPGPHPGWENDSRTTLNNLVIPEYQRQKTNQADSIAKSIIGVGLNFVPTIGPALSGLFGSFFGNSEAEKVAHSTEDYFRKYFGSLTNYMPKISAVGESGDPTELNMQNTDGLNQALSGVLSRYTDIMNKTYFSSPDYLPPVANEAAKDFNQLTGYAQMIKDNRDKILSLKTTVGILGDIKKAINDLNDALAKGTVEDASGNVVAPSEQDTAYNYQLQAQINAFGRVSADMVNGDDIASIDSLTKQIIYEKNYIYKNLLKGPYGCEAWLSNSKNIINFPRILSGVVDTAKDWGNFNVNSIKRITYPFPILYDYNTLAAGADIPDPWNSGETQTTMPANNNDAYGPGFLSFVYFSNTTKHGTERLQIGDLVDTGIGDGSGQGRSTQIDVSVGDPLSLQDSNTQHIDNPHSFETTIGIY